MDDRMIQAAMRGDVEAAQTCSEVGVALPCPFCGNSEVKILKCHANWGHGFHVTCMRCLGVGATGYSDRINGGDDAMKQHALTSWNTRAALPEEPSGWIPCSERMPTPGKRILATTRRFVGEAYTDGKGRFYRHHGTSWETLGEVTHWMAFPEGSEVQHGEG